MAALSPEDVAKRQAEGVAVLDTRPAAQFGAGHVPGAINIALSGQYASWAGIVIGLDQPIILVAEDPDKLEESRMRLARVGIEKVMGSLEGGVLAWQRAGKTLAQVPQISVLELFQELNDQPGAIQVVDVRRPAEWEAGHISQAVLKPLDQLRTMLADLDPHKPIAVHCKSGYRSTIGTSLLEAAGFTDVVNVVGGFDAWAAQKLPVVGPREAASTSAS